MLKRITVLTLISLLFVANTVYGYNTYRPTKASLSSPEALRQYYSSGEYFREIEKKVQEGKDYLDLQIQAEQQAPLAIILDIDETALSNYHQLERLQFSQNTQAFTGAYMQGNSEAIPAVLNLYQHAIKHRVAVFFIGSRPNTPEIMAITTKNLKMAGFDQWQDLILKPLDSDKLSLQEYKLRARQNIALQGYDIVLNIGDQDSDLQGGYAQAKVKLPNPFYTQA